MKILDNGYDGLVKAMDLSFKRHTILTSNVANSETPQFRAREFDFGGELEKALGQEKTSMQRSSERHFTGSGDLGGSRVIVDPSAQVGSDGNSVDLDLQMGKISTNADIYSDAVNFVAAKLRIIRASFNRGGM